MNGVTVNNKDGDSKGGHNTDAFDVGDSSQITISGATVYNQDDCLAVNSGTDITFTGGYCSGGHGLSIGSVGGRDNNVVDTEFEIEVPTDISLDLDVFSSSVEVKEVRGRQRIHTFSGGVDIGDAWGSLDIETFSGGITASLGNSVGGRLDFDSFSGSPSWTPISVIRRSSPSPTATTARPGSPRSCSS